MKFLEKANKLGLNNKLVEDNYLKCESESLKVSEHGTNINIKKIDIEVLV